MAMHTASAASNKAPEFIPLNNDNGDAERTLGPFGRGSGGHSRGGGSGRGLYGPPKSRGGGSASHRPFPAAAGKQSQPVNHHGGCQRPRRKRDGSSTERPDDRSPHSPNTANGTLQTSSSPSETKGFVVSMPWNPAGHGYSDGIVGLHEEIEDLFQWLVPTSQEHNLRLAVIDRIRGAILDVYPNCRVEIFGSFRTGLYLPTSDIDLVICGKWPQIPFGDLSDALNNRNLAMPGTLKVLERAAVPIIKLADCQTGIRLDISFNMANGLRAAELIKHFKRRYPALPKLIYVLKQFLLQRDLNEVYCGGLSSYALILMVVSFLQQHTRDDARTAKANLGVLLVEFLELYGVHFNYTHSAIRICDGGAYIRKEDTQCYQGSGFGTICIEDPYDVTNDVGKSSYGFPTVKKTFEQAYFQLLKYVTPGSMAPPHGYSILSQIIRVTDDVIEFRDRASELSRQSVQQNGLAVGDHGYEYAEDPKQPTPPIRTPPREVTPKELPDRFFSVPSPQPTKASATVSAALPPPTTADPDLNNGVAKSTVSPGKSYKKAVVNGTTSNNNNNTNAISQQQHNGARAEDNSDNMSGVSTATSGSSSNASHSTTSDTDSDLLVAGNVTPNSAMSISPATSEVGSCLRNSYKSSSKSGNFKTPGQPPRHNHNSSCSSKHHKWTNNGRGAVNKDVPDRSDLDLDWRSSANGDSSANEADEAKEKAARRPQQQTVSSAADQDTNWRRHENPSTLASSNEPKITTWRNGRKSRKIHDSNSRDSKTSDDSQANADSCSNDRGSASGSSDVEAPSNNNNNSIVKAADTNQNVKDDDNNSENNNDNASSKEDTILTLEDEVTTVQEKTNTTSKRTNSKRRKKNRRFQGGGCDSGEDNNKSSSDNKSESDSCRVSPGPGLELPNR